MLSRGARARLTTTGYGRSTTRCSSDAYAGGNESAKTLSYANAILRTVSENVEPTVRRQRILFAGFVVHVGKERLPRGSMFGEMFRGKGDSGGQELDWMEDFKEGLKMSGINFEGWR